MNTSSNFTNAENAHEAYDTFEFLTKGLYVYGIPIICLFGICGNMLSFKVFVFSSFGNHSSSIYIAALSLSDTGFLLSLFLSWLGGGRIGVNYSDSPEWCHVMIFVSYVCAFLSVWYIVLIMIDRHIVVCQPFHAAQWCSRSRAKLATGIVSVLGTLIYVHTFFTTEIAGANCTVRFKSFMLRKLNIFIYTDTAITFIIPFAIIFIMNLSVLISIARFKARHLRKQILRSHTKTNLLSKAQERITRIFILLSVMLLVTNLPSHGIRFYIIVRKLTSENSGLLPQVQQLCQIVYYTNFSINFLLYSSSSKLFRKYISWHYFCHRLRLRRRNRDRSNLYG